jgi:hypothetical protein
MNNRYGFRIACAAFGIGAFAALAGVSAAIGSHPATVPNLQASSGDAPDNTTYSQPSPPTMNMGATATFTPPGTEVATPMASPSVKAAPYSGG